MNEPLTRVGRIAFRHEGDWWNAYYALEGTMEGALHLGSIRINAVSNPTVKQHFIATMRAVVSEIFKERLGQVPTWKDPEPGPEHERAGHV